jgi:hypothetical protein
MSIKRGALTIRIAAKATLLAVADCDILRARGGEFSIECAADQHLELLDPGGRLLAGT